MKKPGCLTAPGLSETNDAAYSSYKRNAMTSE